MTLIDGPIERHQHPGLPESIGADLQATGQHKPLWICLQAELKPGQLDFPTPQEERCMVYTSFISGATGVMYFCYDSWFTRRGGLMGISPDPQADYGGDLDTRLMATPDESRPPRRYGTRSRDQR